MESFILIPAQQAAATSIKTLNQDVLPGTLQATGLISEVVTINSLAGFAFDILTFTGNALDTETVTIGGRAYTFQTTFDPDGTDNILVGATTADSIDNLVAAINGADGAGSVYSTNTKENVLVTALNDSDTALVAIAKESGESGDDITAAETLTNATWGTANFAGGVEAMFEDGAAVELSATNNVMAINAPIEIRVDKPVTVNPVTVTLSYGNRV